HRAQGAGLISGSAATPPREQGKLPRAKAAEESRAAYDVLEGYVRFIKRFPDVRFITATRAARIYHDRARERKWNADDLKALAAAVTDQVSFQKRDDHALAASEVFALLNEYVRRKLAGEEVAALDLPGTPYAPTHA